MRHLIAVNDNMFEHTLGRNLANARTAWSRLTLDDLRAATTERLLSQAVTSRYGLAAETAARDVHAWYIRQQ